MRHLAEGEIIYSTGDRGDTIFIINRGVVEVVQPPAPPTYLSLGDVLGDVETLSGLPRRQVARTCEPVSLQCFQLRDFPELIRRAPSFFHFLSSHLAFRLAQAADLETTPGQSLELSGNLANFDLITVYQTANSSQTGQLRIASTSGDVISAFFFEQGQPRSGQFEHLTGEEAFWQLFVNDHLSGTFTFSAGNVPEKKSIQSDSITKNASEMLINALQGRDEFAELKQRFAESGETLIRAKVNLTWPASAKPELEAVAKQIWDIAASEPVTISALFPLCWVCELKIYQAIDELIQSRHFILSDEAVSAKVA